MDIKTLDALIPDSVKTAIRSHQSTKVASTVTGLENFSFAEVATYMGTKIASRHTKWRPISDGLVALRKLRG